MPESGFTLDARWVRQRLEQAAAGYSSAAALDREIAQRLVERLELIKLPALRVLELGCGPGALLQPLHKRYPKAQIIGLDIAYNMLKLAKRQRAWLWQPSLLQADAAQLPLAAASCDLVVANLLLHWCDLERVLPELQRVLRPGGLLMFTTLGPDSLRELRSSWAQVDQATHVHGFTDMHDIGEALIRMGWSDPVLDVERMTLTYPTLTALLQELRTLGANNSAAERARGLLGRKRWQAFTAAYEQWRDQDGRYPLSCEVVYGHAWASEPKTSTRNADGSVSISLSQLRRPRTSTL